MTGSMNNERTHLRPLRLPQDTQAVADLIEICFADTMDPDGWEYLRRMRAWGALPNGSPGPSMSGFVWEEDGRIVGNLEIILPKTTSRYPLIVNVAVHPNYRRRGIARCLTEKAIHYLKSWNYPAVWLQVRADNLVALRLYERLGFKERARRTTWVTNPSTISQTNFSFLSIRPRRAHEWPLHSTWLNHIYPEQVAWNLPLDFERFRPRFLNALRNLLGELPLWHFTAFEQQEYLGFCTWEATSHYADWLWIAPNPQKTPQALCVLLPSMRQKFGRRRPLSINFPAGEFDETFLDCGFYPQQTLIWMELPL
ncbi:MAG: GNAT family N-acetyltransferase [Thermanaerothrix sp.]|uniref:GNAT family N-acetyltransferase n=1 Tax=Thermanaerothrix sp. TaxID=2972675 RepID=UPI003C79F2EA